MRPVEHLGDFFPIVYVLERHLLDGRTGDNHPVELLTLQDVEVVIEGPHVLDGRVLRGMAFQLHERNFKLRKGSWNT